MSKFINFFKRDANVILHAFCTSVICIFLSFILKEFPNYLLFVNTISSLLIVYCIYRMVFKKVYSDSFLKILCMLTIIVFINDLYSYSKLVQIFPLLSNINPNYINIALIIISTILLIFLKLLSYLENRGDRLENEKKKINENISDTKDSKKKFSFFHFCGLFLIVCFLVIVSACLLYIFYKNDLNKTALEFDKIISFIFSYGASFLLILFAIAIVVISLIYIIKYIYKLLCSFKKSSEEEATIPTYAFSVIIVCALLFWVWRISDFTLDDLTDKIIIGDYLAIPIATMVALVLFFLLVQIVHAIFLILSKMTAKNIADFIKKQNDKLQLGNKIAYIVESIISIILDTIISTLSFVSFIPSFFGALNIMVLNDDTVDEATNENISNDN